MISEFFLSRDTDVLGRSKLIRKVGDAGEDILREYSRSAAAVSESDLHRSAYIEGRRDNMGSRRSELKVVR